jgi:hypothetical protein
MFYVAVIDAHVFLQKKIKARRYEKVFNKQNFSGEFFSWGGDSPEF